MTAKKINYSKLIKDYRKKHSLTQVEMSLKLGVSFASINRWENGRFEPVGLYKKLIENICTPSKKTGKKNKDDEGTVWYPAHTYHF